MKPRTVLTICMTLSSFIVASCRHREPRTSVDVMRDGAVVDVQSGRSDVYVGDEGIQVDTRKAKIDIGREGVRIHRW